MENTKVICAFTLTGKNYCLEKRKDLNILEINFDDVYFTFRKRTKEELEIERIIWDDLPHLMSGEGYVNMIKDKLIKVKNEEFPNNLIKIINDNLGKVDLILLPTNIEVLKALNEFNINYLLVLPSLDLKEEYVGRSFLLENDKNKSKTKALAFYFETLIKNCMNETSKENICILKSKQYLNDIIENL